MSKVKDHYPVMNQEVLDLFVQNKSNTFIDCTLGMGGHVKRILDAHKNPSLKVIACDYDLKSLNLAKQKLIKYQDRISYILTNFSDIFEKVNFKKIRNGLILIDPGLSMYQIKMGEKGFSFSVNSELDMRKSEDLKITAKEVVNHYSFKELQDIFYKFGEVRKSSELAQRIVEVRLSREIENSHDLTEIIEKVYNWKPKRGKLHPAAQVFQALRIFINNELEDLEIFLGKINLLNSGNVVVILTYHSLEDRLVKRLIKKSEKENICKRIKPFPMTPSESEIHQNPPSRSAKLRAVKII